MYDALGRIIEVDDIVTYPVRQGSHMWINAGVVAEINDSHILVGRFNGSKDVKLVRVTTPYRVTIAMRGHLLRDLTAVGNETLGVYDEVTSGSIAE